MTDLRRLVRMADPAPEASQLYLSEDELWELFERRRDDNADQVIDLSAPATSPPRPRWTAALASFVAVLALGVTGAFLARLTEADRSATPEERLALSTVEDFFRALTEGDPEAAGALMSAEVWAEPVVKSGLEFLAILPGTKTVDECTTSRQVDHVLVSCVVSFDGPLFLATGQDAKHGLMTVDESGLLTSRPALGPRSPVDRAFVEYAGAQAPEAFAAVCRPGVSEAGTVQTGTGYEWTRRCGELWASLENDAAAWVVAGKPPLPGTEANAVRIAQRLLDALSGSDLESALSLLQADVARTPSVRNLLAFLVGLPGPKALGDCRSTDVAAGTALTCDVDFGGPIFSAMGQTTGHGRFTVRGDLITVPPEFGSRSDAEIAFVEYARLAEPEAFERACSPSSYEANSILVSVYGFSYAGPCADLWARLSDDIAAWVAHG